jgi:hypothetical protein
LPVTGYVVEQEKVRKKLIWNLLAEIRQFSRFARDIEQNGHE